MELICFILFLCPWSSLASFYAMGPPAAPWIYDVKTRIKSYGYSTKDGIPRDSTFSSREDDPEPLDNLTANSRFAAGSSYFWLGDTNKFKHAVRLSSAVR